MCRLCLERENLTLNLAGLIFPNTIYPPGTIALPKTKCTFSGIFTNLHKFLLRFSWRFSRILPEIFVNFPKFRKDFDEFSSSIFGIAKGVPTRSCQIQGIRHVGKVSLGWYGRWPSEYAKACGSMVAWLYGSKWYVVCSMCCAVCGGMVVWWYVVCDLWYVPLYVVCDLLHYVMLCYVMLSYVIKPTHVLHCAERDERRESREAPPSLHN